MTAPVLIFAMFAVLAIEEGATRIAMRIEDDRKVLAFLILASIAAIVPLWVFFQA